MQQVMLKLLLLITTVLINRAISFTILSPCRGRSEQNQLLTSRLQSEATTSSTCNLSADASAESESDAESDAVKKTDDSSNVDTNILRREKRWKAAVDLLEASTEERRRFDHRAKYARLIGIYVGEEEGSSTLTSASTSTSTSMDGTVTGSNSEILVVMQPDQGGRKLLFLDAVMGQLLGFIELETQSAISNSKIQQTEMDARNCKNNQKNDNSIINSDDDGDVDGEEISVPVTSALRGMLVADDCRGKGYARLFLAIWLRLCHRADVTPATTRINKPLLALTLVRLGFTPLRGHHLATISYENHLKGGVRVNFGNNNKGNGKKQRQKKLKEKHRPLAVEVSAGTEGRVLLYSPLSTERLRNGFSATEVRSQRLMVAEEPSEPRGRIAHLRVRYAPPLQMVSSSHGSEGEGSIVDDIRDNRLLENMSQIVHSPLAEGIGGRLRLTASQGPFDGVHPSTLEREETLRQLTGKL